MKNEAELTVHSMPLDALRLRAMEARRLIAQAREIARASFDDAPPDSERSADAPRRVGLLLDAAQRLLPGIAPLADGRARTARARHKESGWRRVTLRGGKDRALEAIERAELLDALADDAASLVSEIERRSSSTLRVAERTSDA